MRVGFLLGAGVSLPAGMPSTTEITDAILRVETYWRDSDETFRKLPIPSLDFWPEDHLARKQVIQLLDNIQAKCSSYFTSHWPRRTVNYEDIYYCISQIAEHLSSDFENPLIEYSVPALAEPSRHQIRELADFAQEYIESVVRLELWRKPSRSDHLRLLTEALSDPQLEPCSIFTLNHDCLIENAIADCRIPLSDGFEQRDGDLLLWDPQALVHTDKHSLLKLHGSVDWLYYHRTLARCTAPDWSGPPN